MLAVDLLPEDNHFKHIGWSPSFPKGGWLGALGGDSGGGTPGRWLVVNPTSGERVGTGSDLGHSSPMWLLMLPRDLPHVAGGEEKLTTG